MSPYFFYTIKRSGVLLYNKKQRCRINKRNQEFYYGTYCVGVTLYLPRRAHFLFLYYILVLKVCVCKKKDVRMIFIVQKKVTPKVVFI